MLRESDAGLVSRNTTTSSELYRETFLDRRRQPVESASSKEAAFREPGQMNERGRPFTGEQ